MRAPIQTIAIAAAYALSACGSTPGTTSSSRTAIVGTVGHRVSVGALSVSVPHGWLVVRAAEPPCFPRQRTIYVWTASHPQLVVPCPSSRSAISEVATLTCYIGAAAHLYESMDPSPSRLPLGVMAHTGPAQDIVQGAADETVFNASAPPALLDALFSSVRLTGRDCSS